MELASAKDNLSFCYVKSPTNGYVGSLPYKEGALVSPSSAMPVTTISKYLNNGSILLNDRSRRSCTLTQRPRLNNAINKFPKVSLQLVDGSIYNHEGIIVKN